MNRFPCWKNEREKLFMRQYMGSKIVKAEPAFRCTDNRMRVDIIVDPDEAAAYYKSEEGCCVRYSDGYVSWSPKDAFEEACPPRTAGASAWLSRRPRRGKRSSGPEGTGKTSMWRRRPVLAI